MHNARTLPRNTRTTHARSLLDGAPIAIEWEHVLTQAIENGDQPIGRVIRATIEGLITLLGFATCAAGFTAVLALLA